jgi:hypothetical protein
VLDDQLIKKFIFKNKNINNTKCERNAAHFKRLKTKIDIFILFWKKYFHKNNAWLSG